MCDEYAPKRFDFNLRNGTQRFRMPMFASESYRWNLCEFQKLIELSLCMSNIAKWHVKYERFSTLITFVLICCFFVLMKRWAIRLHNGNELLKIRRQIYYIDEVRGSGAFVNFCCVIEKPIYDFSRKMLIGSLRASRLTHIFGITRIDYVVWVWVTVNKVKLVDKNKKSGRGKNSKKRMKHIEIIVYESNRRR